MADTVVIETQAMQVARRIEAEIAKIRSVEPLALPDIQHPIVAQFVTKIEGSYDVTRAKTDTDNANDLIYIAYNATPQSAGEIRTQLGNIMDDLVHSQQASERAMAHAMTVAEGVLSSLKNLLPDWLDVRASPRPDAVKAFVKSDLIGVATRIKERALDIKQKLLDIAAAYDAIIAKTAKASQDSEQALASQLADQAAIEKEIAASKAERARLESLVKDLQDEAAKFDQKARDYARRAETAEERAFVMQIVKVGADMLAAALPPIAMAAGAAGTGGTSVLAASAMNSLTQTQKPQGTTGGAGTDNTAQIIEAKEEISKKKKDVELAKKEVDDGKEKVKGLRRDLRKALPAAAARAGDADDPVPGEDEDKPEDSGDVKGIKGRLKDAKTALDASQEKYRGLVAALAGLTAGLNALSQGLGELSKDQKDAAANLRELQMSMLDKAETYETARRTQASELVKVKALLKGKRTEQETIKLTIKSLNISVSALKRAKEIVEEMAFFFKSFADFLDMVAIEAAVQLELYEKTAEKEELGPNALARLVQSTDEFFIKQSAEWWATIVVTQKFVACFKEGWSKLNTLQGTYITGDRLDAYLIDASVTLSAIAEARDAAAKSRILEIGKYRDLLVRDSVGGAAAAA